MFTPYKHGREHNVFAYYNVLDLCGAWQVFAPDASRITEMMQQRSFSYSYSVPKILVFKKKTFRLADKNRTAKRILKYFLRKMEGGTGSNWNWREPQNLSSRARSCGSEEREFVHDTSIALQTIYAWSHIHVHRCKHVSVHGRTHICVGVCLCA